MRAQNTRHGAGENQFGVRRGDVRKLAKEIKTNHELALALWATGNVDAHFLAILLIKPKSLSAAEMDRMVRSVTFVEVAVWLTSYVVKKHPDGLDIPALLDRIESEMGTATAEEQWTMNYCLAEVGIQFPDHRERALAIGEALGSIATILFPRAAPHPLPRSGSTKWSVGKAEPDDSARDHHGYPHRQHTRVRLAR
jgi:3-methyladenine DNA glycosylase AlkD